MYNDHEQWARIRYRVLVERATQRQVARESGISPNTVRKMLRERQPVPYGPREQVFPKLGPYLQTIQQMVSGEEQPGFSYREKYTYNGVDAPPAAPSCQGCSMRNHNQEVCPCKRLI
jgi:hypothetical protein